MSQNAIQPNEEKKLINYPPIQSLDSEEQKDKDEYLVVETADFKRYQLHPIIYKLFGLMNEFMDLRKKKDEVFRVWFRSNYMDELIDILTSSDGKSLYDKRWSKITNYLLLTCDIGFEEDFAASFRDWMDREMRRFDRVYYAEEAEKIMKNIPDKMTMNIGRDISFETADKKVGHKREEICKFIIDRNFPTVRCSYKLVYEIALYRSKEFHIKFSWSILDKF